MNLSSVRETIATALAEVNATIYAYPPKAVPTPSVSVVPDTPYVEPINLGANRYRANFRIIAAVGTMDNEAALDNLESLIFAIYQALPTGWVVSETTTTPLDLGQSVVLTAEVRASIITETGD